MRRNTVLLGLRDRLPQLNAPDSDPFLALPAGAKFKPSIALFGREVIWKSSLTISRNAALFTNTDGDSNTAVGFHALLSNTTGPDNTATGDNALLSNTTGVLNVATGSSALSTNTDGGNNTATGANALPSNTDGSTNTATGQNALNHNTTGNGNTAVGFNALIGSTTGLFNAALGLEAGGNVMTASGVTCIGANVGGADVDNTTWIANVYGVTTQNGTTAPVIVSADGQLGTAASSERFKKDIASMEGASEAILSLRPVTFPLQDGHQRRTAIRFDCRGSRKGKSRAGAAR